MADSTNITLIGFMGTGKTTIGKRLAQYLKWDFVDTDAEIEMASGLSIPEIFHRDGEAGFRTRECTAIANISRRRHCVIATGGGAVLHPENWRVLAAAGPMIHLLVSLDTVLERIASCENRPLIKSTRQDLERLWEVRQPVYAQADYTVDTTGKDPKQIVMEIVHRLGMGEIDLDSRSEN